MNNKNLLMNTLKYRNLGGLINQHPNGDRPMPRQHLIHNH
jgi:hypothetical protein